MKIYLKKNKKFFLRVEMFQETYLQINLNTLF
jgi:hypothetical protein